MIQRMLRNASHKMERPKIDAIPEKPMRATALIKVAPYENAITIGPILRPAT